MDLVPRRLLSSGLFALTLLAAAQFNPLSAQYRKYEGMTVTNIQFEPKDQPIEAAELHDILPLQIGRPLQMADVRATIEKLFATGRYTDIQVDAQPYRDGVAVTIQTKNRWFVGSVAVEGNVASPPGTGPLENATNLSLGEAFSEAKVNSSINAQQRLMEQNGLFRSRIQPDYDFESTAEYQQVNVSFGVESGRRARFAMPVFTGDLKMDAGRILKATKFRRWLLGSWKPMTAQRVRAALEGVRSLYEKDNRLEAKVTLESVKYDPETNSALPTIHVEAGPRIQVNPIGSDISRSRLRKLVPIYEEHAVDQDLLVEGQHNIRDYLQSKGYFEAEVVFKEQAVINDNANIDYLINEGARHRLVAIVIEGNRYFSTLSIRERMFLQKANFLQFPHGRYSENLLRRDRDAIASLYQSNGFRDVRVTSRTEDNYQGKAGDIAVYIGIEEGPQYFVADLKLDGVERIDRDRILARLSSLSGQPFSEFNVAVDRDTILAQYFEQGFPNATFEWSSAPSKTPNAVDLHYVVREGGQQFVREVVVTGNRVTRAQLINKTITLNPGDPLSPTEMTNIQRRLYALGVFARVDTAIQNPDGESDRKYVLYNVEEARRYSTAVGFGAELGRFGGCQTCFEAPAGATGFAPRVSFDIARNNLWGLTHSIALRTRASTLDQRALLTYSWPRFRGNESLTFSYTGSYQRSRDIRTFNFQRAEIATQLTQKLSKTTTVFYRYAFRRVGVSELKISPFLLPTLSQAIRVGITQLNVLYDRRDDPLDPHKGVYNTLDIGLAERAFGSQRNFVRFLGRNSSYHQLSKRFVLARTLQFGDLYSFGFSGPTPTGTALDKIPLPERFFAGGGASHRGFGENQAGPRDIATGFPLGGTALLFNSSELRFPLIGENIGAVLFHDMGNVYTSVRDISFRVRQRDLQDFDYMVHAVGIGLRYRTPVGPFRVDMAWSINPPSFFGFNGKSQQDLINAGVNPCANNNPLCTVTNAGHFHISFSLGQAF
jgi:outer membrane protein assembly complex protein YaeT